MHGEVNQINSMTFTNADRQRFLKVFLRLVFLNIPFILLTEKVGEKLSSDMEAAFSGLGAM
jgi:hypothetical protein